MCWLPGKSGRAHWTWRCHCCRAVVEWGAAGPAVLSGRDPDVGLSLPSQDVQLLDVLEHQVKVYLEVPPGHRGLCKTQATIISECIIKDVLFENHPGITWAQLCETLLLHWKNIKVVKETTLRCCLAVALYCWKWQFEDGIWLDFTSRVNWKSGLWWGLEGYWVLGLPLKEGVLLQHVQIEMYHVERIWLPVR